MYVHNTSPHLTRAYVRMLPPHIILLGLDSFLLIDPEPLSVVISCLFGSLTHPIAPCRLSMVCKHCHLVPCHVGCKHGDTVGHANGSNGQPKSRNIDLSRSYHYDDLYHPQDQQDLDYNSSNDHGPKVGLQELPQILKELYKCRCFLGYHWIVHVRRGWAVAGIASTLNAHIYVDPSKEGATWVCVCMCICVHGAAQWHGWLQNCWLTLQPQNPWQKHVSYVVKLTVWLSLSTPFSS